MHIEPSLKNLEVQELPYRSAVSQDGTPDVGVVYRIPARTGVAVRIRKGQILNVINVSGSPVCDLWAFASDNLEEYLSMAHIHTDLGSLIPKAGDRLVSNLRNTLLTLIEDTSPGVHDTSIACCDKNRYEQLGCNEYHDNCADNLHSALFAIGEKEPLVPAPFNLWMNVPVDNSGKLSWEAPLSSAGDKMTFRADVDVIVVMSACPQDITPVNGINCTPQELQFSVS